MRDLPVDPPGTVGIPGVRTWVGRLPSVGHRPRGVDDLEHTASQRPAIPTSSMDTEA